MKTDVFYTKDIKIKKIKKYFQYNKITKEKLDYIENKTKMELNEFKGKIK